jgi:hypothetical protein
MPILDTLKLARRLQDAGFTNRQATGAAEALSELFLPDVVTKVDLQIEIAQLRTEIAALRTEMRTEIAALHRSCQCEGQHRAVDRRGDVCDCADDGRRRRRRLAAHRSSPVAAAGLRSSLDAQRVGPARRRAIPFDIQLEGRRQGCIKLRDGEHPGAPPIGT